MSSSMRWFFLIGIACLSSSAGGVSAFSKDGWAKRPFGAIAHDTATLRNEDQHNTRIERKPFELDASACSSSMEVSIEPTKVKLAAATPVEDTDERPPKIIIMGGPASGKGTQCERIASQYGVVHLSTGDMLREAVQRNPDSGVGAIAKSYMDAGRLVPDEIMIQIVTERISQRDCQERGWLLDGFPRTPAQAQALSKLGISADSFIFLNVPDNVLIERVVGRRLDPDTGKIYHMKYFPPPSDVVDRLVQRSDDTVEKMSNRLQQFHTNVDAVRSYYDDVLVEIDGTGAPDDITQRIMRGIKTNRRVLQMSGVAA